MKNTNKVRNNLDYMHEKLQIQRFTDTLLSLSVCVVSSNISEEDRLNNMLLPKEKTSLFSIESALLSLGVNFVSVDISNPELCNILRTTSLALINVHGEFGEDGRIQGLLDYFDIPYIGSSTLAHSVSYDKLLFTSLLNGLNISTPKRYQISDLAKEFPPCSIIAKPRRGGSSIGIKIFDYFSQDILSYSDDSYLFEEFIKGKCLTVACLELENTFLIGEIMEVVFMSNYYDNTSKMNNDGVSYVKTKSLSHLIHSNIIRDVKLILERVDYAGFVRFDIMLSGGDYHFLEANTIPGMSTEGNFLASISPKGFSYSDILVSLIKQTYEKHKESASVSTKN